MLEWLAQHRDLCTVVLGSLVIALLVWVYDNWRDRRAMAQHYEHQIRWRYVRYGGGGTIEGAEPMTEAQALDFCRSLGAVMYVDRAQGFIFYRPKT